MISSRRRQLARIFLILIFVQIMAGFQASTWPKIFSTMASPALWICVVVYVSLFREVMEGLITLFLMSFGLSVFTSLPEGYLTLNFISLFYLIRFLKSRVFVPTSFYFASSSAGAVLAFSLIHGILSRLFDETSVSDPEYLNIFFQSLLTFLFAYPIYGLLRKIDHLLKDEDREGWGRSGNQWEKNRSYE